MPTSPADAPVVMWFRRDLRLADHPALTAAATQGSVLPVFVLDPRLSDSSRRTARLHHSLRSLAQSLENRLVVLSGRAEIEVPRLAQQTGASKIFITQDCAPFGRSRDERVTGCLAAVGAELVEVGSPYAVTPGRIVKSDGTPYRVYTPFYKSWLAHGWPEPLPPPPLTISDWVENWPTSAVALAELPTLDTLGAADSPHGPIGEFASLAAWNLFQAEAVDNYGAQRDFPGRNSTSRLSASLRFGEIHPRTLLHDLIGSGRNRNAQARPKNVMAYVREIAFREFYADVVFHEPQAVHRSLDPRHDEHMRYDTGVAAEAAFRRWQHGETGFPLVDAGMRQLLAEGWMHNRVRMVVASFLVKDLHLPWWWGANWFMRQLVDGDVASNSQGWQWAAGCGTDAAPYFRVFNPIMQSKKFDPEGVYLRRYLPELRHLSAAEIHTPWLASPAPTNYPAPMVDHAVEREEALARFAALPPKS